MSLTMAQSDRPKHPRVANFKGKHPGGRPPGRKNRATIAREKLAKEGLVDAEKAQVSPLSVMLLGVQSPEKVSDKRFARAQAAAPYCHPRLTAVAVRDLTPRDEPIDLSEATPEELAVLRRFLKRTEPKPAPTMLEHAAIAATDDEENEDE